MDAKGYAFLIEPPSGLVKLWRVVQTEHDIAVQMCFSKEEAIASVESRDGSWTVVNDYIEQSRLDTRWYCENPESGETRGPFACQEDAVRASLAKDQVALVLYADGKNSRLEVPESVRKGAGSTG